MARSTNMKKQTGIKKTRNAPQKQLAKYSKLVGVKFTDDDVASIVQSPMRDDFVLHPELVLYFVWMSTAYRALGYDSLEAYFNAAPALCQLKFEQLLADGEAAWERDPWHSAACVFEASGLDENYTIVGPDVHPHRPADSPCRHERAYDLGRRFWGAEVELDAIPDESISRLELEELARHAARLADAAKARLAART